MQPRRQISCRYTLYRSAVLLLCLLATVVGLKSSHARKIPLKLRTDENAQLAAHFGSTEVKLPYEIQLSTPDRWKKVASWALAGMAAHIASLKLSRSLSTDDF